MRWGIAGLLLIFLVAGCQQTAEERAIAEVVRLGGEVFKDGQTPGLPVVTVRLVKSKVTDGQLQLVKNFPHLRTLDLRYTNISDGGLEHLERLTELQTLQLDYTNISDAGLARLRTLKELRKLTLSNTEVTDIGLVYLEELPQLAELTITNTKATERGVGKIHKALPNAFVNY